MSGDARLLIPRRQLRRSSPDVLGGTRVSRATMTPPDVPNEPAGSGTNLPPLVLTLATICAALSTLLSIWTVILQLRNYRKITLQRWVIRILVM